MMQRHDLLLRGRRWARSRARKLALATSAGGATVSVLCAGVLPVSADAPQVVRQTGSGDHAVVKRAGSDGLHIVKRGSAPDAQTLQCLRDNGAQVRDDNGRVRVMMSASAAEACGLSPSS